MKMTHGVTSRLKGGVERLKGIVSRDWAELEMMSVDRSEVVSIAGSYFYSFLTAFSCLNI